MKTSLWIVVGPPKTKPFLRDQCNINFHMAGSMECAHHNIIPFGLMVQDFLRLQMG